MKERSKIGETIKCELLKELILRNGSFWLRVAGYSMTPTISTGEFVKIENVTSGVKGGDIVAVNNNGKLLVHRILYTDSNRIVTKGDNLIHVDPPIEYGDILGNIVYRKSKKTGEIKRVESTALKLMRTSISKIHRYTGQVIKSFNGLGGRLTNGLRNNIASFTNSIELSITFCFRNISRLMTLLSR